jgi:hypothetical protein
MEPVRMRYFRVMMYNGNVLGMPRHAYERRTVIDADNNELARTVVYAVRIAAEQYAGHVQDITPAQLHAFVQDHIVYDADLDPDLQRIRMPWRTLLDEVTDCKSSAIFIGGLSLAQGHQVAITFIDEHGAGHWGHVYAVVDGVPCDPLLPYGQACRHRNSCTIFMDPIQ